jgi:hypothetical protein
MRRDMTVVSENFRVRGAWLKACGYGSEDRVLRVVRTYRRGPLVMADLDRDGQEWTIVASWPERGEFV